MGTLAELPHGGPVQSRRASIAVAGSQPAPVGAVPGKASTGAAPVGGNRRRSSVMLGQADVPEALRGKFTNAQVASFRAVFEHADADKNGKLDVAEVAGVLAACGEAVEQERIEQLFAEGVR